MVLEERAEKLAADVTDSELNISQINGGDCSVRLRPLGEKQTEYDVTRRDKDVYKRQIVFRERIACVVKLLIARRALSAAALPSSSPS